MNMYWVYDLPNWLFGTLTIAIAEAIGLGGLYATRKWVRRIHGTEHSHNEVVGFFLSAICVFYGITLALLAVGTWQIYSDVDSRVGEEAAAVGVLYRDISSFPEPTRTELQTDLRQYTRQVIDVAWPLQRRGIVPQNKGFVLSALQSHLVSFEPRTEGQKELFAEAHRGFSRLANCEEGGCRACAKGCPALCGPSYWRGSSQHRGHLVFRHEKPSCFLHFWVS
jgi:hypothetical protein